jgi:alkylation response protein AidB-like acyl-CoA dehydrogenase
MTYELTPTTPRGVHLVALAERLADQIAPGAAQHDRDGSFPFESLALVRDSGYLVAPIPEQHGGLGVASLHDVLVGSSRLARGDASLTIGINMHLAYVLNVVRRWQVADAAGNVRRAAAFAATLADLARDRIVLASATSELGQDLTRPGTAATRAVDGWIVSGHKVFCTMSPAADVLYTAVTYTDDRGRERYGYAMIPRDTPGVIIHNDWDALGMRASGSNSVSFEDVELPIDALRGGFPVGDTVEYIDRNLLAGLLHTAAALGVAESALAASNNQLKRRAGLDPYSQVFAAEAEIELSASRAVFSRAADLIDEHYRLNPTSLGTAEELTNLFAEAQRAKAFVSAAAARIVDRALALSGGAGYRNDSPLARAYRDVRATAFMHPLGADRAYAFLGELAAGRKPALH